MRHLILIFCGLSIAFLFHCLSPPGKRVAHTEGFTATAAGTVWYDNPTYHKNQERELLPPGAGSFLYGFKSIPLQVGLNIPGGVYFSQADIYYNYLNSRRIRMGAGALLGVMPGAYHLLGFPFARRHEFGVGFEYLRGSLFWSQFPENIYATWLQLWSEIDARSLLGIWLQYQNATGMAGMANCQTPTISCPLNIADQGSIALRGSYTLRLAF